MLQLLYRAGARSSKSVLRALVDLHSELAALMLALAQSGDSSLGCTCTECLQERLTLLKFKKEPSPALAPSAVSSEPIDGD